MKLLTIKFKAIEEPCVCGCGYGVSYTWEDRSLPIAVGCVHWFLVPQKQRLGYKHINELANKK